MKPSYINKKGKIIELTISEHAKVRFAERWKILNPTRPFIGTIEDKITELFSNTNIVKNLDKKAMDRLDRYGKDTKFFRSNMFTFVVSNATIQTIEISDHDKRYLNRIKVTSVV